MKDEKTGADGIRANLGGSVDVGKIAGAKAVGFDPDDFGSPQAMRASRLPTVREMMIDDAIRNSARLLEDLPQREPWLSESTGRELLKAIHGVQQSVDSQKTTLHREEVAIKGLTWWLVILTVVLVAFAIVQWRDMHALQTMLRSVIVPAP